MTDLAGTVVPGELPLTETQRVVDTFTSPTKTFVDIRRKATFWGPLIIMILVGLVFAFSVQQKIGWDHVYENKLHQSPKQEEKLAQAPDGGAAAKAIGAKITGVVSYVYVIPVLIFTALYALLYWATLNFGFGGTAKYGQVYAVCMYSTLVVNIKFVLAIIAVFAGLAPDSFIIDNPVGTNIGYYLSPDLPLWLRTFCAHIDIFEIWSLVLTVFGVAVVARVSKGKAAAAVVGWWVLLLLVFTGLAALQS